MVTYCTVANVEAYIGETFTTSTSPTIAMVENFIERAEKEIDALTGTSYVVNTFTNELYDYDRYSVFVKEPQIAQVGRYDYSGHPVSNVFRLNNYPIVSVTTLSVNKGTSASPSWTVLTEGTDFIKYMDEGVIAFISSNALPVEPWQGIKITYTSGHSAVPLTVEKLCTLMTVKEVLRTKQANSSFSNMDDITIESISISKSTGESVSLLDSVQKEIDKMMEGIVGSVNYTLV